MTDQLKPKAWLINHRNHCTGIEIASDERADVIEHWRDEGVATPLYEVPEDMVILDCSLLSRVVADAYHNVCAALHVHESSLGRTTNKNRRTAEEYEHQIKDAEQLQAMIKASREK